MRSSAIATFKTTCTWNAPGNITQGAKIITLMLEGADAFQAGKQKVQSKMLPGSSATRIRDDAYFVGMGNPAGGRQSRQFLIFAGRAMQ
jgi:hypothetical protein